jgi:hypothetical protein
MSGILLAENKLNFFPFLLKLSTNKSTERGPPQKEVKGEGLIICDTIIPDQQTE